MRDTEHADDPRTNARSLDEVPLLLRRGTDLFNSGDYWHAHEAWEEAWHALRAGERDRDAVFVQGLILATAACENLKRGKPAGFVRQMSQALHQMRTSAGAGEGLGLEDERGFVDALLTWFLDAARRTNLAGFADLPRGPPALAVSH